MVCKVALLFYIGDAGLETLLQVFLGHSFTKDDENGVITCKGSEDLRNGKHIQGNADRVGVAGSCLDDSEVAGKFNGQDASAHILDIAFL